MWTDEQLLEQGWTQEQIEQWKSEQTPQVEAAESVVESQFEPIQEKVGSSMTGSSSLLNDKTQIVVIVLMLVVAPLSLYSSLFAEGPEGPQGESGQAGVNGTAGSSFHLIASGEELPLCDATLQNQIFFVADVSGFQVCQNNVWSTIDLTGDQGEPGVDGTNGLDGSDGNDGADGVDGTNGTDGSDGSDGEDGLDGQTSLIVSSVAALATCPSGGTRIDTGIDDDRDGFLAPSEIDSTLFVCNGQDGSDGANGADGADGSDGADGADGADGSSTTTMMVASLEPAPTYLACNGSGQLLKQGLDDGSGGGIAQNGILESGEIITTSLICTTFDVAQVDDINVGTAHSMPSDFATINSTMYFTATSGGSGGIWSMDVNETISSVYSGTAMSMRAVGDALMFLGSDPTNGLEPWIYYPSNGTASLISDVLPGTSGSFAGEFTLLGTTVFFAARDTAGVYDLWAYDLANGSIWNEVANVQPTSLIVVGSDLYFSAGPNNANVELWKHDSTTKTTFMVKDINPGILSSDPSHLTAMGTTIYMAANAGTTYGTELYAYETTNNSTWLAADIRPSFAGSAPSNLVVIDTRVYFQATSGTHFEMWAYESTNHSFWEVTSLQSTSGTGGPHELTVGGYTVYFAADDGTTGEELWAHNLVNGTTWQVIDLKPTGGNIGEMHHHNGNLYFAGEDNTTGIELWRLLFSREVTYV